MKEEVAVTDKYLYMGNRGGSKTLNETVKRGEDKPLNETVKRGEDKVKIIVYTVRKRRHNTVRFHYIGKISLVRVRNTKFYNI